ncbi:unnamed protein product [Rotaria sp. Silwood1]|nr:unnamed protein product [Rotaria sp. Silwood1]CAF3733733.1 unnamed protein product [Rotaria sp. Silwood1]CAF3743122.1 unnamed protein product [Rotaria sp. Silwood1]CAF4763521.1 unnamed protein product [Rotaria sp. Silwood1]CAF4791404.1 unnamed protein product [Rotaria sp. Silwood1]
MLTEYLEILYNSSKATNPDGLQFIRVVQKYERSVIMRLGRTLSGTKVLHEILTESENMAYLMQVHLYEGNKSCGVKVERVEIKDVRLSVTMQRSMAAEAKG